MSGRDPLHPEAWKVLRDQMIWGLVMVAGLVVVDQVMEKHVKPHVAATCRHDPEGNRSSLFNPYGIGNGEPSASPKPGSGEGRQDRSGQRYSSQLSPLVIAPRGDDIHPAGDRHGGRYRCFDHDPSLRPNTATMAEGVALSRCGPGGRA